MNRVQPLGIYNYRVIKIWIENIIVQEYTINGFEIIHTHITLKPNKSIWFCHRHVINRSKITDSYLQRVLHNAFIVVGVTIISISLAHIYIVNISTRFSLIKRTYSSRSLRVCSCRRPTAWSISWAAVPTYQNRFIKEINVSGIKKIKLVSHEFKVIVFPVYM